MSEWAEILWAFMKSSINKMLKISASYLEKKSFVPKKWGHSNCDMGI